MNAHEAVQHSSDRTRWHNATHLAVTLRHVEPPADDSTFLGGFETGSEEITQTTEPTHATPDGPQKATPQRNPHG